MCESVENWNFWDARWKEIQEGLEIKGWKEMNIEERLDLKKELDDFINKFKDNKLRRDMFNWKELPQKESIKIDLEGKEEKRLVEGMRRKKFGKAGTSRLTKKENLELGKEMEFRKLLAEINLNIKNALELRRGEAINKGSPRQIGRKGGYKVEGKLGRVPDAWKFWKLKPPRPKDTTTMDQGKSRYCVQEGDTGGEMQQVTTTNRDALVTTSQFKLKKDFYTVTVGNNVDEEIVDLNVELNVVTTKEEMQQPTELQKSRREEDEMQVKEEEKVRKMQMQEKKEEEEPDATPSKASDTSTIWSRSKEMRRGIVSMRKDALRSPAMKGCSPKSLGKIVRKRDLGMQFKSIKVANLKKIFETSSLTTGNVEGPSQLLYTGHSGTQTSSSKCVSQSEGMIETEPRDILDLGIGATQDWPAMTSLRCNEPMRIRKTGA